jgi:DNA mismatch repair protein MutL
MGQIQILDEHVANQIAAGEVVERPSSIVKELIENAIDAQATSITVQVEEGGIRSIRVIDNGVGMDAEDAQLAFSRHATSKIRRDRDLFSIRSLGFRGEALPSIASVAKVTLITAPSSGLATKVRIEGGDIQEVASCAHAQGTDVLVEDLFYNTPARLKYLKTVNTEIYHIAYVVERMALAYPQVAIRLQHNQRQLFQTAGDGELKHVFHSLYGRQVVQQSLPLQAESPDFQLRGLITKPEVTRASRSYITWILNGRHVRSVPLTKTLLRSYGTLLPTSRYPIAVIALQMDPRLLDVNVHPAKLEVRLSKEKECCQLIEQACRQALQKQTLIPQAGLPKKTKPRAEQQTLLWNETSTIQESHWQIKESVQNLPPMPKKVTIPATEKKPSIPSLKPVSDRQPISSYQEQPKANDEEKITKPAQLGPKKRHPQFPRLTPLTQVHGTYIVAQAEDGFYLLDQHAAHERIYYEIFFQQLDQQHPDQQMLLLPLTLETSPSEAEILQRYAEDFSAWGLSIESFGQTTFLVRSHPTWFPSEETENLIFEVLHWVQEHGQIDQGRLRDASAKMMACKAAIKANHHLRRDEMVALIDQLAHCQQPFTCPHGRPITVHFSTYELEKMFKRVM